MARTTGITRARFTSRIAISRTTPKAAAGSHRTRKNLSTNWPIVPSCGSVLAATAMPPFMRSHPVPAKKPPTTGYGMNRARLPSRNVPSTRNVNAVNSVTIMVAATTVRNAWSTPPNVCNAALEATIASTGTAASCTLPTTPRTPALQARIARVSEAATRKMPIPDGRASSRKPLKTSTANEIARTTSTTPMTAPAETVTITRLRSPSDTGPLSMT